MEQSPRTAYRAEQLDERTVALSPPGDVEPRVARREVAIYRGMLEQAHRARARSSWTERRGVSCRHSPEGGARAPQVSMEQQRQRYVRNEWLFREVNERISEVNEDFEVEGHIEFLCECGRQDCLETVRLSRADYARIRAEGDRFVLRPGHERESVERVLESHADFVVVEKVGEAGERSEAVNPRS